MRLTCAVPYLATSAISPSTMAGRALSASISTASLSWAMVVPVDIGGVDGSAPGRGPADGGAAGLPSSEHVRLAQGLLQRRQAVPATEFPDQPSVAENVERGHRPAVEHRPLAVLPGYMNRLIPELAVPVGDGAEGLVLAGEPDGVVGEQRPQLRVRCDGARRIP